MILGRSNRTILHQWFLPCTSPGLLSSPKSEAPIPHIFHHKIASKSTSNKIEILHVEEVLFETNFQRKVIVWGWTKLRNCNSKMCYGIFYIIHMLLHINKIKLNLTEFFSSWSICSFPSFKQSSKLWLIPFQCYVWKGGNTKITSHFDFRRKFVILCRKSCSPHVQDFLRHNLVTISTLEMWSNIFGAGPCYWL